MSYQATDWAKRQRVSGNLKALLFALATYTKKETGKSWHPQATLADDVGVSTRTIRRLLVQLRELGLIHTEPTKRAWDGGNGNLMITLLMELPDTPEISIVPKPPATQDETAPLNVARPHPADDVGRAPRTVLAAQEPSSEPSLEPESNIRNSANAEDASDVDRGEHAGETSTTTGEPLPSSSSRSPAIYAQSEVEAAIAWRELERMEGWSGTWEDDPLIHWHDLLRKGYAAEDILDAAAAFLRETPWLTPSLGDWLGDFESYQESEDEAGQSMRAAQATQRVTNHHHMQGV
ncbi:helix-turn-helix domain-containing protein [Bradyrhizobium sp. CCGUVB14]|uniref:helix-turn-helix domain-containing protein n=1 Tax=Bradyrhizobium sp. CCGUVB14 TaxID=2949628 RepID=UPI0020B3AD70|nr:helix-turn-helix domain-containing protein [Bradyrhizobium sp. CCGUVB14]MCP3444590.1 helix-turn-helix domain-containing protein [Bradyrhizobium sp. CCGUVB14]